MAHSGDLAFLLGQVLALLKEKRLEEARERLLEARREACCRRLEAQQGLVDSLNRSLLEAKQQREQIGAAMAAVPEADRQYTHLMLLDVLDGFDREIAGLRAAKRAASRGA